jgi:hypothetical protein
MFGWLKRLFRKDADLFYDGENDRWWESKEIEPVRVGNGPEQTGTQPGEGLGWKGSPLKESTERLKDAVEKASTAIDPNVAVVKDTTAVVTDQPIVWAPVGEVVVSKPKVVGSKSNAAFREAVKEKKKGEQRIGSAKERKPKKLNKGLAAKAKKAKTKREK